VILLAIEELAFVRHYTVALLSENLYFLTSAVAVDRLVRFAQGRGDGELIRGGLAAGVSSLIRPALMLYLVPAVLIVAAVQLRMRVTIARAAVSAALLAAVWLATLAPATIRNYVIAGEPVLISNSPTISFINYNLPPTPDALNYRDLYLSGVPVPVVFARIAMDHPVETARAMAIKLGFSLGLLQLMGARVHPELVAASLGYLLALALCPATRAPLTWPIHGFVLAHLAGMVLTMPSNYGYRLILPLYLFFPMFAACLALAAYRWAASLRTPRLGVLQA
jgi:hypothetical protein